MTEQKNALAQLFAACWKDEALKARFIADPKAVLAEYGMPMPDRRMTFLRYFGASLGIEF